MQVCTTIVCINACLLRNFSVHGRACVPLRKVHVFCFALGPMEPNLRDITAIGIAEQRFVSLESLKTLQRLVSLSSDWYRWVFATIVVAEVFAASGNAAAIGMRLVQLGILQRLISLKALQRLVSLSSDCYRWVFATMEVCSDWYR